MSRVYHDKPLTSIPVKTHDFQEKWPPQFSGKGVILEGTIEDRTRHVIVDTTQNKRRYFVLHIHPLRVHRRQFDAKGKEIEPNFSETGKVRQGYLHSSYKTVAVGQTDLLTADEAVTLLSYAALDRLLSGGHMGQDSTRPRVPLWMEESRLDKLELNTGDTVRVKTTADCPLIETLAKLDIQSSSVSNYAGGEQVGASWTDKVMSVKANVQDKLPQDSVEGVDEDEWDD